MSFEKERKKNASQYVNQLKVFDCIFFNQLKVLVVYFSINMLRN